MKKFSPIESITLTKNYNEEEFQIYGNKLALKLIEMLNKYKNFPKPQMINQLQVRLMLELMLDELEESQDKEEFTDQIAIIDLKYKYGTTEDGFVWSKDLESCFPKDKFWFLYRIIDGSRD